MKSIATTFYASGAVFALIGMAWGIQMSASQDHTLSPAHGHLNLIGFVAMSVFGTYYALTPSAAASALSKAHYALTVLAVVILVPGIVMAITQQGEALAKAGSVLALLSMALFCFMVVRNGVGTSRADS
jgi:cbb3-type cytochrome oxidase subunit 1